MNGQITTSMLQDMVLPGGLISVLFALLLARNVLGQDRGTRAMQDVAGTIFEGAVAFMRRQYLTIAVLALLMAALIGALILSLTLVPLLCSVMLKKNLPEEENFLVRGAKRLYAPALGWALAEYQFKFPWTFEPGVWAGIQHDAESRISYAGMLSFIYADVKKDDPRVKAAVEVFREKLVKRGVSLKALKTGDPRVSGKEYKVNCDFKAGISQEQAKKINKLIKDEGPKAVKTQVMGDELRVTSKSRDDLQAVQKLLNDADLDFAVQYTNYR